VKACNNGHLTALQFTHQVDRGRQKEEGAAVLRVTALYGHLSNASHLNKFGTSVIVHN
jgi:hypothetical protein